MTKFLNILKFLGLVIPVVAAFAGVFWFLDNIQDEVEDNSNTLKEIQDEKVVASQERQDIKDSLADIKDHQDEQDEYMQDMERAANFYIRNQENLTEKAMQEALEAILKKNGMNEPVGYVNNIGAETLIYNLPL